MITEKVLIEIARWRHISGRDPSILVMNPRDVTALAREGIGERFATQEQLNPVPFDKISRGHRFAGIQLDSHPDIPQGKLHINDETITL